VTDDGLRQAAEDLLSQTLLASAQCLSIVRLDSGEHLAANDAYLNLYGYTRDEVIGRTSVELRAFSSDAAREAYVSALRRKGVFFEQDHVITTKTGVRVACRLSSEIVTIGGAELVLVNLRRHAGPGPAEERLKRELDLWRGQAADLLQHMPVAFLSLDAAFRITYANGLGESLLQRPLHDLIGTDVFQVFPAAIAPSFRDAVRRAMRERVAVDVQDSYSPTGRWFEVTAYPSGTGLSVFLRDVTSRKDAEGRLAEAEEKYRALVEQVPAAIYLGGLDGHLIYSSPRIYDLLEVTPEEIIASPELWHGLVHPEEAEAVRAAGGEAVRTGRPWRMEYRMVTQSGRTVWVRDEAELVRDENGNRRFWRGVMVDVTQRKEVELALRAAEDKYRSIVEQVPAVIYVEDMSGKLGYLSPQYEQLFGFQAEERMADPDVWVNRIHPDDRERVVAEDRRTNATGDPFKMQYRLSTKDGRMLWVQDSCVLVRDENGVPQFWQGVLVDETALKRAEEELTESLEQLHRISEERRLLLTRLVDAQERERTQIASDIHDDSVQVITAVGLRLHALRRTLTDPDHLALLDRLDRTVADAVARLRRLMFDLRPLALERDGLATAVESWLSKAAVDAGFDFRVVDHLSEEPAEAIRVMLYRICAEALTNVRKHAHARHVAVTMESKSGGVLLTVQDDGVGFEVESTERVREAGHVGLSTIRERCRMGGGWCRIESLVGEGTSVRVWLPRMEAAA
jgi:PAS domain S-box-containing protein